MNEQTTARLTVLPGNNSDVCPLCQIHRENAGFLRESCGDGYLKPGCFVARASVRPKEGNGGG